MKKAKKYLTLAFQMLVVSVVFCAGLFLIGILAKLVFKLILAGWGIL